MSQTITAIFENGVLKPNQPLELRPNAQVRLTIEYLDDDTVKNQQQEALAVLEHLWRNSSINSQGDRLTREQLHERC